MINAITLMSEDSNEIEILTVERNSNFPSPPQFIHKVSYHKIRQFVNYDRNYFKNPEYIELPKPSPPSSFWKALFPESLKLLYRRYRNICIENLVTLQEQFLWFKDKFFYIIFCLKRLGRKRFDVLIAVDEIGMIVAMLCNFFKLQKPLIVFWSLEIDSGKSPLFFHRFFEILFSYSVNYLDLVVIQEETRLLTLSKKLGHSFIPDNVCLVPHSPLGDYYDQNKVNYFNSKFNFSSEDVVILHAGWIHDAMCVDQLAACCVNWKHSYKLVLHEREFRSENEPFIQHVIQLSEGKAHLSLQPVCFDRIDEVFSSARIGIIAYDKRYGGGRENAHKASGKLGHYLKCGVPVIALDLPGYRDMFAKYKCGMVFQDFDEVEKCIDIIINNYDSYSSEALRCFQDEFEFSKYFNPFYQFLKKSTRHLYI